MNICIFEKTQKKNVAKIKYFLILVMLIAIFGLFFSPVKEDVVIHIPNNQTFNQLVLSLEKNNIITHPELFKIVSKFLNLRLKTGDYLFKKNTPFWSVLYQLKNHDHKVVPIKTTIREGLSNQKIAEFLAQKLPSLNKENFISLAKDKEGELFPDSYFFFPLTTEEEIIKELNSNFERKIKPIKEQANVLGKDMKEVLIMGSILEGESNGNKDNRMISGILWKRLSIGMPLQVDVDKDTYFKKGLPEKPLNNPGLNSLKAALEPISSDFLYYLHDKEGVVHYAKNYDEHRKNINTYLK